jgi:hypothetical protein
MTQKPETVNVAGIFRREWKMPILPLHAEFKLNRTLGSGMFAVYVTHKDWTMRLLMWPIVLTGKKEPQRAESN